MVYDITPSYAETRICVIQIRFIKNQNISIHENGGITVMQITDVKIRKLFEEGPMRAIVSVTFDSQLAVHDIKVINARDKFFIVMPSRKNPDETYRDIVHPINAQFRAVLEASVIAAYDKAVIEAADAAYAEEPEEEAAALV